VEQELKNLLQEVLSADVVLDQREDTEGCRYCGYDGIWGEVIPDRFEAVILAALKEEKFPFNAANIKFPCRLYLLTDANGMTHSKVLL
jgi:hypothetical protein